jgi:hypothetical protein
MPSNTNCALRLGSISFGPSAGWIVFRKIGVVLFCALEDKKVLDIKTIIKKQYNAKLYMQNLSTNGQIYCYSI